MENQFIKLNKISMFSTEELSLSEVFIRKTSITRFEVVKLDCEDYTISYEMKELFNKQIFENITNPLKDERSDNPFSFKCVICIYCGEKYFFVYESTERIAKSLGGVDE